MNTSLRGSLVLLRPRLAHGTVLPKCQGQDLDTYVLTLTPLIFLPWNTVDANIAKLLMGLRQGLWNLQSAMAQSERELSTSQQGCLSGLLTIENEWPDKDPDPLELGFMRTLSRAHSRIWIEMVAAPGGVQHLKIPEAAVPGSLELLESSWVCVCLTFPPATPDLSAFQALLCCLERLNRLIEKPNIKQWYSGELNRQPWEGETEGGIEEHTYR